MSNNEYVIINNLMDCIFLLFYHQKKKTLLFRNSHFFRSNVCLIMLIISASVLLGIRLPIRQKAFHQSCSHVKFFLFVLFCFNNPGLFLHVNLPLIYDFRKCHLFSKYLPLNFVQFVQCSLLSLAKAVNYSQSCTDIVNDVSTEHQQGNKNNMILPMFQFSWKSG